MSDIINRFKEDEEDVTTEKYLTFIDKQTYAVVSNVKEIISIQDITTMPDFLILLKELLMLGALLFLLLT